MYKIRYYYSSLSKQFLIGLIFLSLIVRLVLFFISGAYQYAYVGATIVLYALILAFLVFLLVGWRFFYSEFDENTIASYNLLTRKKTELDLAPVSKAVFSKSGIGLYYEGDAEPRFKVPFYRFGVVSPVGVENFMNLMKNHRVEVEQTYKVLPGFTPFSKWLGRTYAIFSVVLLISTLKYLLVIYAFFTTPR